MKIVFWNSFGSGSYVPTSSGKQSKKRTMPDEWQLPGLCDKSQGLILALFNEGMSTREFTRRWRVYNSERQVGKCVAESYCYRPADSIMPFYWSNWEELPNTLIKRTGPQTEVQTAYIPNTCANHSTVTAGKSSRYVGVGDVQFQCIQLVCNVGGYYYVLVCIVYKPWTHGSEAQIFALRTGILVHVVWDPCR
jgi:hypothetical protein